MNKGVNSGKLAAPTEPHSPQIPLAMISATVVGSDNADFKLKRE